MASANHNHELAGFTYAWKRHPHNVSFTTETSKERSIASYAHKSEK